MRLTLRTLLAWRDATLPPPLQGEMEQKIAASAAARGLEARIERLVADGTLAASSGTGIAADPNVVAEYLDNVLSVAALDGFERSCLEADPLLAEVGACHRLLAEVSRDPSMLPTLDEAGKRSLIERLQRAASEAPAAPRGPLGNEAPPIEGGPDREPTVASIRIREHQAAGGGGRVAARHQRQSSTTAWLLAITAMLLLGALVGTLAWSAGLGAIIRGARERALGGGAEVVEAIGDGPAAADPLAAAAPPVAVAANGNDVVDHAPGPAVAADVVERSLSPPAPEEVAPPIPPAETIAATAPPADVPAPQPPVPEARPDDAPPPPEPRPGMPAGIELTATVPFGDALAILAPPAAAPAPAEPAAEAAAGAEPAAPAAQPLAAADTLEVIGDDVLLVAPGADANAAANAADDGSWTILRSGHPRPLPVRLLAPAFGRPALDVAGLRLVFTPGTRATLDRGADDLLRLRLESGSVVAIGAPGPQDLRVVCGGLEGVATCVAAAPWGLEVASRRPPGRAPHAAAPEESAHLLTTSAATLWRQSSPDPGAAPLQAIPARSTLTWTPAATTVVSRHETPPWLVSSQVTDPIARAAAGALRQRLADGEPAGEALEHLAADRRAEARIAAVATLALTGRYEPAAALLTEESPREALREQQWTTLLAAVVPPAVAAGPDTTRRCLAALETAAPPAAGPLLTALIMDDPALLDGDATTLADALESPWLVVRRAAWQMVCRHVPPEGSDRLRYRPDRTADLNAAGVAWWRERLAAAAAAANPAAGR